MKPLLQGIRILDLSRILAGPFATQLLADLGATVIKVEPLGGDPTRTWGPPFAPNGQSAYFRCANRGKTKIELDLRSEEGRAIVDAELRKADVVVENFLPRSARDLGLDAKALRARFPRLVIASIRSFASDTEAKDRAGYDFLMQAEAGWMQITGEVDGRPHKVGVALVDVLAGLYASNAIQAALLHRERTSEGTHVEIPLFETALAGLVNVGSSALLTGARPERFGNAHPNIVPYQSIRCRDGEIAIAVGNDRQFKDLCAALGIDVLPEWSSNPGRVQHRAAVIAAIERATASLLVADVERLCADHEVAAGPIRGVEEALALPPGMLHRAVHVLADPASGEGVRVVGSPILVDGDRACATTPPPL